LKNIGTVKNQLIVIFGVVLLLTTGVSEVKAETLTASTSLRIVHITEFKYGTNTSLITWPSWPTGPDHQLSLGTHGQVILEPAGQGNYLDRVSFTTHSMGWSTSPYLTPYPTFPNTVNSMIAAVWSLNGGQTFIIGSWDYLAKNTHTKGIEGGMPDCYMGTMIHSLCDRKAGECNGRNRSNLYFTEYPNGASCWGTAQ